MVTINEIARIAGVSRGTVDRVLNGREGVSQKTAERVQTIASSLNYMPNSAGRSLAAMKKDLKFAFVLLNDKGPYSEVLSSAEHGKLEMSEYGIKVLVRECVSSDYQGQITILDELHDQNVCGIVISPINHPHVISKMAELSAAGVTFVTYSDDVQGAGRIAYVGTDYKKAGKTAAGIIELISKKPKKVGIISCDDYFISIHADRKSSFIDKTILDNPDAKILDIVIEKDDDILSYSATRKLLEENPDMDALYLNGAGVRGACQAVKESQLKIPIVCGAMLDSIKDYLLDGTISAIIEQEPEKLGSLSLQILFNYLVLGIKPESEFVYTGISIRIAENI